LLQKACLCSPAAQDSGLSAMGLPASVREDSPAQGACGIPLGRDTGLLLTYHRGCPGFGQDRVNFHQNPGRGTAVWADPTPTWRNRAGYSIPCAVMLGSGGGGGAAGAHSRLGSARRWLWRAALWVVRFMSCFLLICIVVVPVSLCLLFC